MTASNLPEMEHKPVRAGSRQTDPAADTEPLLHLHKMSTTAGLGSQDYVAVNVTAVVAVVFGLASPLCLLGYLLLIIPLVGTVLGVVALRQIHNSSGTQTGRGFAWAGLVLSAGITAVIGGWRGADALHRRSDENAIASLCSRFGQYVEAGQFDQAYSLFDDDFHSRVPLEQFKGELTQMQQGVVVPAIDAAEWNGLAEFIVDPQGVERAATMIKLHYKGYTSDEDNPRLEAHFSHGDDGWHFSNIGDLFPTAPNPKTPRNSGQ